MALFGASRMCDKVYLKVSQMRQLRRRLAAFMKGKRAEKPLREFAARYRLSKDTVARIENEEQNVTIDMLDHMCKAFRCDVADLFPPEGLSAKDDEMNNNL